MEKSRSSSNARNKLTSCRVSPIQRGPCERPALQINVVGVCLEGGLQSYHPLPLNRLASSTTFYATYYMQISCIAYSLLERE